MAVSVGSHLTRKKQHFPYEIAVLCYESPSVLNEKTLALLHEYHIPPQRITLFVQSKSDGHELQRCISRSRYGRLIVGEKGVQKMNTLIHTHYPPGSLLVVFNDDITGLLDTTQPHKRVKSLLSIIRSGFEACKSVTTGFWGVYPIAEETFLRPTISSNLCYASPSFWGCIIMPIHFTTEYYTQYERILTYYKVYSASVRLNHIAVLHRYSTKGLEDEALRIQQEYPKWVSVYYEGSGVYLRIYDSSNISREHK